ncbi:hypothetical protein ACHWQZ_G005841 [Mnemiopsis leidyi]
MLCEGKVTKRRKLKDTSKCESLISDTQPDRGSKSPDKTSEKEDRKEQDTPDKATEQSTTAPQEDFYSENDSEFDLFEEKTEDVDRDTEDKSSVWGNPGTLDSNFNGEVSTNSNIERIISHVKTEQVRQHFGALTDLQEDLQKLIASSDHPPSIKPKTELLNAEETLSTAPLVNCENFDPSRIQLAAESFRNICMTLARAKHLNETKDLRMELSNRELWEKFHTVGNEMIITRSGRRLFPKLSCTVSGLKPTSMYVMLVDIVPADNRRYRFCSQNEKWVNAGHARPDPPKQVYIHPDSPQHGDAWMRSEISFHKLKVQTSNFYEEFSGHTVLNSQHRYQPRVHVVQCCDIYRVPQCPFKTFIFPETAFFAVTTYQSSLITEMKIANNPFAKGFRAPGTATQAAGDRHEAKGTENIVIELETYGAPPFLAAGGAVKHTACGKSTVKTESNLAPSMLASTSSSPKTSTRYQLPHSKPSPNWTFPGPSHRPSMITAQPLFPTQMRPGQMQLGPGHPQLVPGPGPHRYPVSSIPVSSEYPIQRIMRPGYAPPAVSIPSGYGAPPASVGPPPGYGGPSGAGGAAPGSMGVVPPGNMVHWGFNTPSHFRPQAGMVPQSIQPAASQSPNPPLPTSPQVVNIPDSTQDKEMTTPVKDSPVCSPSANSANSSPSADATIKVRLAGSEDFFEVELSDIGDTYASLVKCLAEELDVKSETVSKIRKLPNILIRKDRDVKRIKSGSEFEVELNAEN